MRHPDPKIVDDLRASWTDRYVRINSDIAELKRFEGRIGRVVTINWSGKAIVDFADGAWYDIPAADSHLRIVPTDDPAIAKFNHQRTSAQERPERQG